MPLPQGYLIGPPHTFCILHLFLLFPLLKECHLNYELVLLNIGVCFLICILLYFKATLGSIFSKTKYFFSGRQAFTNSTNMASSGPNKDRVEVKNVLKKAQPHRPTINRVREEGNQKIKK